MVDFIETRISFNDQGLDIPIAIKTLADVYDFQQETVDLRLLYQTLANLSLGFPTMQMDKTTSNVLYGVYKVRIFLLQNVSC